MTPDGNTILLTGGGSGIGEALAHRLHDAGNTVIISGRRRDALERAAKGRPRIHVAEIDVADGASIAPFAQRIMAEHPSLNVLINNAGIMRDEVLDTARDLRDAEATVTTNLLGPIRLTNALIDPLVASGRGVIVNVTSGLAFVPLTLAPTYCATKAAIHSYTVSLREILRGRVEVIELAPPGVQTDLTPGQSTRPSYVPLAEFIDDVMKLWAGSPPEILVEQVKMLRNAERENRFDETVVKFNEMARKARG